MNLNGLKASAKTIRTLTMDAIEKAKSGHPGLPMGCAELGSYIFGEYLRHNPEDINWINRDRFVLSAGHGSMLLYSLMYLSGYEMTIDDIKQFRQLKSNTPGHPEFGWTKGVETTTGPLGQGLGNAVGMAIASKRLAQKFNKPDFNLIDNKIVVLVGDGDLMEGVSYEVSSIAGLLKLNNLVAVYDSNRITIEGSTDKSFTEDVQKRFEAQGWAVTKINGHDYNDIKKGFDFADATRFKEGKPVLIIADTTIGKGSPGKQGKSACHGAPLGEDEICACRKEMGVNEDFYVDPDALEYFGEKRTLWVDEYKKWNSLFEKWQNVYPELRQLFDDTMKREFPDSAFTDLPEFETGSLEPTRKAANKVLNKICEDIDFAVSGSADLSSSTMTFLRGTDEMSSDNFLPHNLQYGIREHAMGTIINGLYLYGGVFPIAGTFLSFSTYMMPAIRMAALMRLPVVYLFSHDSIFVGEDGPTHHPVEHVTKLRIIPNLNVMRPADANETKIAWEIALKSKYTPSVIITTRQKVPVIDYSNYTSYKEGKKGAYILKKEKGPSPDLILISSGSEISITLEAAEMLENDGISTRVVNMFSTLLFERTENEYKEKVLPDSVRKRLAVEAGSDAMWHKYIGLDGDSVTINKFGISAPAESLKAHFGLTADNVYKKAKELMKK